MRQGTRSIAPPLALVLLAGACAVTIPSIPSLPTTPPGSPAPPAPPPATGAAHTALEDEVHDLVNRHRQSRGLAPLAADGRVAELAREHSAAMASGRRPFGHAGFEERGARVQSFLRVRTMAENVAYDSRTPLARQVVEGWLGSSGHRRNIEGAFDVTGVGIARSTDGTYYLTQIFVALR